MNAFEEAWEVLKALEEQQLFSGDIDSYGHLMDVDEYGEIPPGSYVNLGTIHPAALGMARRLQAKQPFGTVQIQRLQRPELRIQERTGSPEPMPYNKRNVEDIKRYGGIITDFGGYKTSPRGGRIINEKHPNFRIKPDYPDRDPIYLDTPLQLEGGM